MFEIAAGLSLESAGLRNEVFVSVGSGVSKGNECLRCFVNFGISFSLSRFLFRALTAHDDSSPVGDPEAPTSVTSLFLALSAMSARSASSCCRRKSSSCSLVSFFTASSRALVDSSTESRNSTSSSSRLRNWFFNRIDSSKASCLAAIVSTKHLTCQPIRFYSMTNATD